MRTTRDGIFREPLKNLIICASILLAGLAMFLPGIDSFRAYAFDESLYVSAARQTLGTGTNENWAHPPLAKALIGAGISMFGDNPLGWRFMSAVFGGICLAGIYAWSMTLFRRRNMALYAVALTALNQVLFVQARIAMLDIFMLGFDIWALAAFTEAWLSWRTRERWQSRLLLLACGVLQGLAIACKWSALVLSGLLLIASLILVVRKRGLDWKSVALLAVVPAVTYLLVLTFTLGMRHPSYAPPLAQEKVTSQNQPVSPPRDHYRFDDILRLQSRIWSAQSRFSAPKHHCSSLWFEWPMMARPCWYSSGRALGGSQDRPVVFLGNPLILWLGFVAVIALLFLSRGRESLWIVVCYAAFLLSWSVIPRQTTFFYYYFPAAMVLGVALTDVTYLIPTALKLSKKQATGMRGAFLVCAAAVFLFFLPLISGTKMLQHQIESRMWLQSWRYVPGPEDPWRFNDCLGGDDECVSIGP